MSRSGRCVITGATSEQVLDSLPTAIGALCKAAGVDEHLAVEQLAKRTRGKSQSKRIWAPHPLPKVAELESRMFNRFARKAGQTCVALSTFLQRRPVQ